jgi:hypothetical protein
MRELDDSADRADNIAVTMVAVEREGRKEKTKIIDFETLQGCKLR